MIRLNPRKKIELSEGKTGECFAFDHETGVIFHLNRLATLILAKIMQSPHTVDQLVEEIRSRFTVPEGILRADLGSFLDEVCREDLAEWIDGPP